MRITKGGEVVVVSLAHHSPAGACIDFEDAIMFCEIVAVVMSSKVGDNPLSS